MLQICRQFKLECISDSGPKPSTTLSTDFHTTFTQCCLNIVSTLVPGVGYWHSHNIHTMLPENCLNVGSNIATTFTQHSHNVAWIFSQCQSPTLRATLQHSHNIAWTLSQHHFPTLGTDVETTFTQQWKSPTLRAMLPQHSHNIFWMMSERWTKLANVVTTLGFWSKYNIHMTLSGYPHNITGTFGNIYIWMLPQHWDRRWGNVGTNVIVTTLPQRWSVSWVFGAWLMLDQSRSQCCGNIQM